MRLVCKIIPHARQNKIVTEGSDAFKIYLTASPHNGQANRALIKVLADYFEVGKNKVRIIKGEKSREKVIWVEDSL